METRKTTALTTVITGLKKFTNYSLQVLAFTKVGDGVLTSPHYCQTEEDGKDIWCMSLKFKKSSFFIRTCFDTYY